MRMRALWMSLLVGLFALSSVDRATAQVQVKPWFLLIFDTSGSMDQYTDSNDDGLPSNSCGMPARRINDAKCAVRGVVNASGDATFGLAQFSQGTPSMAEANCCPNGRPNEDSQNYDVCDSAYGTCGADFNSGRMRVGIVEDNQSQILSLIDYTANATCSDELFPAGSTPLGGVLHTARRYFENNVGGFTSPTLTDNYVGCRPMAVILLTDGEETCGGNAQTRATELRTTTVPSPSGNRVVDIRTYVIGFGVAPGTASIENIAIGGGTDAPGGNRAFYAQNQTELSLALTQIIADSQINEVCDGADNDCDTRVDEGWALYCDPRNRRVAQQSNVPAGAHQGNTGTNVTTQFISSTPPTPPNTNNRLCTSPGELCNGLDDDCDNTIDENPVGPFPAEQCGNGVDDDCDGLADEGCGGCTTEICDGIDNDCDGVIDDGVVRACGNTVGICTVGTQTCVVGGTGTWGSCTGVTPTTETCNGLDDNCDGVVDGITALCPGTDVGECQRGTQVCTANMWGSCVGTIGPATEICDGRDNDCDGTNDDSPTGIGVACGSGIGECNPGTTTCQTGAIVCTGATLGSAETCDNQDDDCDGAIDDGNPGGGAVCGISTGECSTGTQLCVAGGYVCQGAVNAIAEICDGLDNDCNGANDNGNPGGGAACGTNTGECTAGTRQCQSGSLNCVGSVGPTAEICDGLDNDCNGIVDDGNPGGGQACGTNTGECTAGTRLCVSGAYVCQGSVGIVTEICDGLDNDCDGTVDDGNPGGGGTCGTNVGECTAGTRQCSAGALVCAGEVTPTVETCDGQDDDCDGVIDNGNPGGGQVCGTNTGECTAGTRLCVSGSYVCQGEIGIATEVCDGLDNDCDGTVDDGNPGGGGACGVATGECNTGTLNCQSGALACLNAVGPATEACDALDNDCDGITDEGNPGGGQVCGSNTGECTAGNRLCVNGAYVCQGEIGIVTEVCNGLDDDCDGTVDDGNPGGGGACGVATGQCNTGTLQCQTGALACVGSTGPASEACDALDNDCDGITDEGNPGGGQVCGSNTGECNAGSRLCVSGAYICQGEIGVATEICDALDNDCDGRFDENNPGGGGACGTNTGECTAGVVECQSGNLMCAGEVLGGNESCDALDNDCDGITDEGNPGGGQVCGSNTGVCSTGTRLCVSGAYLCEGETGATTEVCDGLDNNCNGQTDENNPGGGGACGSDVGECTAGGIQCRMGALDCVGDVGGSTEICDGQDDDCDGIVDEGNPGGGGTCGMNQGECTTGTQACVGGVFVCEGSVVPTPELCDGLDNDCDGTVDDGNPGGNLTCGIDTGECATGTTTCTAGALVCQGNTDPITEACNTRDDDCDGSVDEGNPGGGGQCGTSDVGECEFGADRCIGGAIVCIGFNNAVTEICNGLDDDCDTMIDEGVDVSDPLLGQPCGEATGVCTAGTTTCDMGMLTCSGGQPPVAEICNGLDDDCDGFADDGILINAPCGTDVGECQPGMQQCDPLTGAVACEGAVEAVDETCDALDNDCDGSVDEGLGLGEACGESEGECVEGRQQCVNGQVLCTGEVPPSQEACDCSDNDCDGNSDETPNGELLCPSGSSCVSCQCARECFESEFGLMCPTGKAQLQVDGKCFCVGRQCDPLACPNETTERNGEVVCAPGSTDVPACTCRNNACGSPCDGVTCGQGTSCDPKNGTCVDSSCIVFGCPDGQRCNVTDRACESDPCTTAGCSASQGCRDGNCFDTCAGVTCDDGRCVAGECETDLCANVTCGTGEACDSATGMCGTDACSGVACGTGFVCNPATGGCDADPCAITMCPAEQRCVAGECVEPETMPDGGVAGQDGGVSGAGGAGGAAGGGNGGSGAGNGGTNGGGGGAAGSDVDASTDDGYLRVLATGGGGCSCSVPSGTSSSSSNAGAWFGLGVIGLWMLRRRARARRLARSIRRVLIVSAMLAIGAAVSGCSIDPFCVDCKENGSVVDGGKVDSGGTGATSGSGGTGATGGTGGSGSGGTGGTGGTGGIVDSGTDANDGGCLVAEICNGTDDDCDGNSDEGFDTATDTRHCGACNQACGPDHAIGQCTASECRILECDVGFLDLDDDDENGCEYRCLKTADVDSVCDLRDNDCDGNTDEDVTFATDPLNCGSCGFVCRYPHAQAGSACVDGACALDPTQCDDGFHDADGNPANGCEYSCTVRDDNGVPTPVELCNVRDDDCDGEVDEDVATTDDRIGDACGMDVGECQAGTQQCMQGQVVCVGETRVDVEVCDGLDNDCDGTLDESDPRQGVPCGESAGTCDRGLFQCNTMTLMLECVGGVGPVSELCDGLDNDCDSLLDEGNPQGGATCGQTDVGACALGTTRCIGGVVSCDGDVDPVDDSCDGIDNDCDGNTDENNPGGGGPCGTSTGECNAGSIVCQSGALGCTGGSGPATEACDGLDNDCDGKFDEGNPGGGASCGTDTGACSVGAMRCISGTVVCQGAVGGGTETCDGVDNDCDGNTDENNPGSGASCGTDVGACTAGIVQCQSGALACIGRVNGGAETCDGTDNDCDGKFDEGNPGGGASCGTDTGACVAGAMRCVSGAVVCTGAVNAGAETCDGLDNDCDTRTDENNPGGGASCGTDVGECTAGAIQCQSGALTCVGRVNGTAETCDGQDDDCDGSFDEGNPGGGQSCGTNAGECSTGTRTCLGGAYVCTGAVNATTEVCDGQDDDCDGNIDEGNPGGGASCGSGVGQCRTGSVQCQSGALSCVGVVSGTAETCDNEDDDCDGKFDEGNPGGGQSCGTNAGECSTGLRTCLGGAYACTGAVNAGTETCDGLDNDCDGAIDNGNPGGGGTCGSDVGQCTLGTRVCQSGALACTGGTGGVVETCDGLDNDCDGRFDEGNPGGGATCGIATGECSVGAITCSGGGLVCVGSVGIATEVCDGLDNDCDGTVDDGNPGGGGTCGSDVGQCTTGTRQCQSGALVCIGAVSGTVEVCDGQDDDCDGNFDEGNPGGGASCGIATGECSTGTIACSSGALVCTGSVGATAETCDGLDNDCNGVNDNGNPGGGSSCGTDVGQCSTGTMTCSGGSVSCVGAVGTVGGVAETCDGLDNDCDGNFDEGNPGGGASCGVTATGLCALGTRVCAGGSLVCQGEVQATIEICDNLDQDCDGNNTNGFALTTDVNNCGSCGNVCSFVHGIAGCSSSACTLLGCQTGYFNDPTIAGNDCLYACNFTGAEICDGLDNDCDGSTDELLVAPVGFCARPGVCNPPPAATCGGLAGWSCNYSGNANYQVTESRCDALDNDCDGSTDEAHPTKNATCTVGTMPGQCTGSGTLKCNAGNLTGPVVCLDGANQPVVAGAAGDETCDGVDNDCDGNTDEPCSDLSLANQNSCVEEGWAPLTGVANTYVMQYEASRTDATALTTGTRTGSACSNPGVMPWTNVTYAQARTACQAAGADLCYESLWQSACMNPSCTWSYSAACSTYAAQTCNGNDYGDTADAVLATGTLNGCTQTHGSLSVFDLSGNVKEWTRARATGVNPLRGGASNNTPVGISCGFDFALGGDTIAFPNIGFRCCKSPAVVPGCQTYTASGLPLVGPDPGTTTSSITVPVAPGVISDINILGLAGTTDRFQDMRFSLRSPTNVGALIIDSSRCGSDDNWSFSVDDAATNVVTNDNPFCNGSTLMGGGATYRGAEALTKYNGANPSGTWTLTMTDVDSSGGAPTLTAWSIQVCRQ